MPAAVDDPNSPAIQRVSGRPPFPDANGPALPPDIVPRQVTLRDRQTVATIVPFASRHEIPASLIVYLCAQINKEIEGGDTYPFLDTFTADGFADYWFQSFGAIMLLGNMESASEVVEGQDWAKACLGSFYVKPNYPGRSSHVCNGGLLVTDASRNRGVGRLMGETYIEWAPRLGYTYSVFNLVYETNVASCKIWDALGFKRIGRVKGCGNLKSYPDRLIDAIIYGRDLAPGEGEELVSEERFDKIRFYLKYGKYPNGADRAEKSRLRSAATHYKLLDGDKLMLKDKEVISDPGRQYEIARTVHVIHHGGINKTTATIAEKYHWSRIKETVSDVIRTCAECKELGKTPNPGRKGNNNVNSNITNNSSSSSNGDSKNAAPPSGTQDPPSQTAARILALQSHQDMLRLSPSHHSSPRSPGYANPSDIVIPSHHIDPAHHIHPAHHLHPPPPQEEQQLMQHYNPMLQDQPPDDDDSVYQPIDPQIINHHPPGHDMTFEHYHAHADFQALLSATEDGAYKQENDVAAAVDRDLEMLIEHDAVEEAGEDVVEGGGDAHRDKRAAHRDRVLYDGFGGG